MTISSTIGTAIGQRSPDWSLPTLDGDQLGPALVRGTRTLFFFWGSW